MAASLLLLSKSELGTDSLGGKELGTAMQRLGAQMDFSADEQMTTILLKGEDKNMDETLQLLGHFLGQMKADEEKLESIKDAAGPSEKSFWDDNTDVFRALAERVIRGERSSYLNRLTAKELKKQKASSLLDSFKETCLR